MKRLFVTILFACVFAATPARADVVFISGATSPAAENVLFNQPGLIQTGNPVQGRTELTNFVLNFTHLPGNLVLTTTAPGEPRISALGFVFNSLHFQFENPLVSFTELDFSVTADQVGFITFTAITTDGEIFTGVSTLDAPFVNPFSVVAFAGQRLREVSFSSPAPFTVDVRGVHVGGVAIESNPIPEPGTLALLVSSLIPLAGAILRCRKS